LDEEKSKHVDLAQQNGFSLSIFGQVAEAGKKAPKKKTLTPAREEVCNEYDDDLTAPCF
jgi:hypothetical protein